MVYANNDEYKGEWRDDKKEGTGKMNYSNGNVYDGQWKNNKKMGQGISCI